MDAIDAIRARHSIRQFSDKQIPKEAIEKIVDCGRLAPTARKEEPWEFVVVTDKDALAKMGRLADHGPFIKEAGCAIVVCCRDTKYYLEDGCAATENILVAAAGLGIGSCWVAGDKKPYAPAVLELLGAPAEVKLVSIIALGYPVKDHGPLQKRPLTDVLHWERY
jgi:nitroreductase